MKHILLPLVAMTVILTCCGCKTSKRNVGDAHYSLVGPQWDLEKIDGVEIGAGFALRPFITFDTAGGVQGSLGCNTFFGGYSANRKHKLTLDFQGATKRLCQQMEVEKKFMQALKRDITRYEIEGEELILFSGDDEVMRFVAVDLGKVE